MLVAAITTSCGAVKQWNKIIRESLRTETRLTLGTSDERVLVPIKVVDGLPVCLKKLCAPLREENGYCDTRS